MSAELYAILWSGVAFAVIATVVAVLSHPRKDGK